MNNFEKNRKGNMIGYYIGFAIIAVIKLAIIGGIVFLTVRTVYEINEVGLKEVIENIWEGQDS